MSSYSEHFGTSRFAFMTYGADPIDIRIDKWLWAARFYKTRSLASEAVAGGKVAVNGQRCKPSRSLRVGDELIVQKSPFEFQITVQRLSDRRGPAKEAITLYEESEESKARRYATQEQMRLESAAAPRYSGRPNKKDRRLIVQFTRR